MANKKSIDRSERPFLGEISSKGLSTNFRNYAKRVTGQQSILKFIKQGLILSILSDVPSVFGSLFRGKVYRSVLGNVGKNCLIEKNVSLRVPQKVFLGNRVYVGENVCLDATFFESEIRLGNDVCIRRNSTLKAGMGRIILHEGVRIGRYSILTGDGGIEIGKNSLLANMVELNSSDHIFDDPLIPIKSQGTRLGRIKIGKDVWIGSHALILPDVTIGDGSVIGAGAVVTKNIPKYSIAVGAPAKVIKTRGSSI